MTLKVVTINILSDLSRWKERRELLSEQLADLSPDILALQEVSLPENPSKWLAEQLSQRLNDSKPYGVYLCPKSGSWGEREGIAILSRFPVKSYETIDLGGQGRVAQRIQIEYNQQAIYFANVHLFWQPGHSMERLQQVQRLIQWMDNLSRDFPVVICGDFNDTPESESIQLMYSRYSSACKEANLGEPAYTCPTPLPVSIWSNLKTIINFAPYIRLRSIKSDWKGTLDYIFFNLKVFVEEACLTLDEPHPDDANIFPSDHFGLYARLGCFA